MTPRRMPVVLLLVPVLLAVALGGCVGGGAGPAGDGAGGAGTGTAGDGTGGAADAGEGPATGSGAAAGEAGSTDRPHVHDRWDDATEKVLLDEDIPLEPITEVDPEDPFEVFNKAFCTLREFGLPEGTIVPPGTETLDVTLGWSSTDPMAWDSLSLLYMPANANEWDGEDGIAPGETRSIEVTVKMADGGHAPATLWRFQLVHCPLVPEHYTGLTVHAEMVAHRVDGPLPLEPPHPDFWGNGTSLLLYEGAGSGEEAGAAYMHVSTDGGSGAYLAGDDHGVVPPGTRWLVLTLNWTNGSPLAGTGVADAVPYVYWIKGWWFDDWHRWEPTVAEEGHHVYVLPVTPSMTDGLYADESRWRFSVELEGEETAGEALPFNGPQQPYHFDGTWEVRILALAGDEAPAV